MNLIPAHASERVGPAFSEEGMLQARQKTRQAIRDIASRVSPGMLEEDAVAMAKQVLVDAGMSLSWHPTRVRFGRNTIYPMKRPSEPGVRLQDEDIFFVDIAPRFDAWEGDGGASFTIGNHEAYTRCARDAEHLFHEARQAWQTKRLTGERLYAHAATIAKKMGWELNFDLPGHRVSDFPHAAIHTGSLAALEVPPSPMRWILEIHLRDPQQRFGAFYEDMLLNDEDYR
ncbi:MAG: M24 family metallopeptidase [Burkholderiaceae bacterium]